MELSVPGSSVSQQAQIIPTTGASGQQSFQVSQTLDILEKVHQII